MTSATKNSSGSRKKLLGRALKLAYLLEVCCYWTTLYRNKSARCPVFAHSTRPHESGKTTKEGFIVQTTASKKSRAAAKKPGCAWEIFSGMKNKQEGRGRNFELDFTETVLYAEKGNSLKLPG